MTPDLDRLSRLYRLPFASGRRALVVPRGEVSVWQDKLAYNTCEPPDSIRHFPDGRVEYSQRDTALTYTIEPERLGELLAALK